MDQKTLDVLERIEARLNEIDKTLIKQHASLDMHIYRTELAEHRLTQIETQMGTVNKHILNVEGAGKLLAIVALVSSILVAYIKFTSR